MATFGPPCIICLIYILHCNHSFFVRPHVTSLAVQLENCATVVSGSGTTWCLYRPAVRFLWKPLDPPPHPALLRPKLSSVFVNIRKYLNRVHWCFSARSFFWMRDLLFDQISNTSCIDYIKALKFHDTSKLLDLIVN